MKEFVLNDSGVCINPNIIKSGDHKWNYTIKTAKIGDKWYHAFDFNHPTGGWGCSVSAGKSDKAYKSEHEAIAAAAKKGLDYFSRGFDSGTVYGKKNYPPSKLIQSLKELIAFRYITTEKKQNQRYVIYDQFHWLSKEHLEIVAPDKDTALAIYNFEKEANPDKTLGLVTEDEYKKIKESLKQAL